MARSGPLGSTPSELSAEAWKVVPGTWIAWARPACASRQYLCNGLSIRSALPPEREKIWSSHHRAPRRPHLRAPTRSPVRERHLVAGLHDVVDPVDVGEQFLAGGVDVGGGFADAVHHVRVVLDRRPGGADAIPLIVKVGGQRALGYPDDRRRDAEGEHRRPWHQVQRVRHPGLALGGAVHYFGGVHRPIVRHERIANDDVLGAGSLQADDIPGIL